MTVTFHRLSRAGSRLLVVALLLGTIGCSTRPPARIKRYHDSLAQHDSHHVAWYFEQHNLPVLIDTRPARGQYTIRLIHFHARREPEPRFRDQEIAVSIRGKGGGTAEVLVHHFLPNSQWKRHTLSSSEWDELIQTVFGGEFMTMQKPRVQLTGPTFILEAASHSQYRLMYVMSPHDAPSSRSVTPGLRRLLEKLLEVGRIPPEEVVWGAKRDG